MDRILVHQWIPSFINQMLWTNQCAPPDLDASTKLELLRQLMLCSGCKNALGINSDVFVNVTLGLNVSAPFCVNDSQVN